MLCPSSGKKYIGTQGKLIFVQACNINCFLKVDNNPISCSGNPILRTNLVTSIKVDAVAKLLQVSEFLKYFSPPTR